MSEAEAAPAPAPPQPLTGSTLWLTAFTMALANFTVVLDTTIANVSVPHIAGSLAIAPAQGTWAITSYSVADAISVPLAGWLAMRFGTVRWFLVSLAGFGLFSLLCGLSQNIESLVLFRVLQGFAGGPLMPLSQALLVVIFPPKQRGAAVGLWAATTTAAPILGPILGGMISDNMSWHWIFFINLPVVALCFVVISRMMKRFETTIARQPIDVIGFILLVIGIGAFQIMLDTGREHDWFESNQIIALAVIAAVGTAAFIIWELTDDHPIVDIRIFRHRGFAMATGVVSLVFGSFFAIVVLTPLWLQSTLGYTASQAGNTVAWIGVMAVGMAPIAGLLLTRVDPRITVSVGVAWLGVVALMRTTWSTESDYFALALPHFLTGIGMPFFFIGLTSLALGSVKDSEYVSAAGIMSFVRTLCGAIGAAIATSSWENESRHVRTALVDSLNDADAMLQKMQGAGMSAEQARGVIERMIDVQAATVANLHIYSTAGILFLIAAAAVWLIPRVNVSGPAAPGH
jgi:DHA2 family multidrug resistance protein